MMFWGVTLDPGKRYTQTVEKSFHLSMAALGFQNCSSTPVTVMVEEDKAQFALCTLQPGKLPQQPLDYCFTEGEEITFFTEGPGDVHLTGYLMDEPNALEFEDDEEELTADSEESESASVSNAESEDDESSSDQMTLGGLLQGGNIANDDDDDEDEESGDDDWDPSKDNPKRRKQTKKEKNKKTKSKTNDSKEHNDVTTSKDFEQAEEIPQSSEDDDDDDDNDDDDDDYEPKKNMKSKTKPKKKEGNKKKRKNQETEQETVENGVTQPQKLTKKAKKLHLKSPDDIGVENTENANALENNSESQNVLPTSVNSLNSLEKNSKKGKGKLLNQEELQQTKAEKKDNQSQATETTKRKLPGGTVLEEITKGSGKVAKKGQRVHVYYKGNLAKNKKQFDACLSGPPFSFRLGTGEVIRGWDLGVAGMQVGGKRRLTVPPSQGYGKKKMGPIPANSTLEFEIQLIRL